MKRKLSTSAWQQEWAYDRPFNWGNASILSVDTANMYSKYPESMFTTKKEVDIFYIPSGCA